MKVVVTGGAGFIGRWVTRLLVNGTDSSGTIRFVPPETWVVDNLSRGFFQNIEEFRGNPNFRGLHVEDVTDAEKMEALFAEKFDICFHLAANINVQHSIDEPSETFHNDVVGTFQLLDLCRRHRTKMVLVSTCMVYDAAAGENGIAEHHALRCASPYAASKLAAEKLVESFHHAYRLPVAILRPFNTYGPFQRTDGEGGVVGVFLKRKLAGEPLQIYGDGTQTRDLLYVEDCARFIVMAGLSDRANGKVLNAGLGADVPVNDLARMIVHEPRRIKHVPHIHPQAEIARLRCDYGEAARVLGWRPTVSLAEGIQRTERWLVRQSVE
jgi:nucleoside-diphosphate-sugar epimerase